MSTGELRRGPGWWMDLEGQWNPPEVWPESSPPLPGWVRAQDGTWRAPGPFRPSIVPNNDIDDDDDAESADAEDADAVANLPSLETTPTEPAAKDSAVNLGYAESTTAVVVDDTDQQMSLRLAIGPMLIAGLTASMIAAGLILLLLLL